jgi:hypothetical protein
MIPPVDFWPKGFTTDYATGIPDQPMVWGGVWWNPLTWFDWIRIDLRESAWWHDLRYYLGWAVPRDYPLIALAAARPYPNDERSDMNRVVIDGLLEIDFIRQGFPVRAAVFGCQTILRFAGTSHYWWATPEELKRRGLN